MFEYFHNSGNSSLLQIELIGLRILFQIVLPPAVVDSLGIWSTLGDSSLIFSIDIATPKHWVQSPVALLYVLLSA